MRIVNGNHKSRRYSFPLPLVIRSEAPILISDGKVVLKHGGEISIRSATAFAVEFELKETTQEPLQTSLTKPQIESMPIPEGFRKIDESTSHGGAGSLYEYYKRDVDVAFLVQISRNENVKQISLGSLLDSQSIISKALDEFSRGKPFYRRDLVTYRMPAGLKHGQVIKSCLDILTHEKFLERTAVQMGERNKTERYVRTTKRLP